MNPTLIAGTRIVVLALIFYTTAFIIEQKKMLATNAVLLVQSAGLGLDITATILMILGSTNTQLTVHGFIGYSALTLMIIKTFLIWKHRLKSGITEKVDKSLHSYSRVAYIWWVVAFMLGTLLVFL